MELRTGHRTKKTVRLQKFLKACGLSKNGLSETGKLLKIDVRPKKTPPRNKRPGKERLEKTEANIDSIEGEINQNMGNCKRSRGRPRMRNTIEHMTIADGCNLMENHVEIGKMQSEEIGQTNDLLEIVEAEVMALDKQERVCKLVIEAESRGEKSTAETIENIENNCSEKSKEIRQTDDLIEIVEAEVMALDKPGRIDVCMLVADEAESIGEKSTAETSENIENNSSEKSKEIRQTDDLVEIVEAEVMALDKPGRIDVCMLVADEAESIGEKSTAETSENIENNSVDLDGDMQSTQQNQNYYEFQEIEDSGKTGEATEIAQSEELTELEKTTQGVDIEECIKSRKSSSDESGINKNHNLKDLKIVVPRLKDEEIKKYIPELSEKDSKRHKKVKKHKKSKQDKVNIPGDECRYENISYSFRHSTVNNENRLYEEGLFDSDSSVTSWENYYDGPVKKKRDSSSSPIRRKKKKTQRLIIESDEDLAEMANDIEDNLVHFVNPKIRITCKEGFQVSNDSILFVKNHMKLIKPVVLLNRLPDLEDGKGGSSTSKIGESHLEVQNAKEDFNRREEEALDRREEETLDRREEEDLDRREEEDLDRCEKKNFVDITKSKKTNSIRLKITHLENGNGGSPACETGENDLEGSNKYKDFDPRKNKNFVDCTETKKKKKRSKVRNLKGGNGGSPANKTGENNFEASSSTNENADLPDSTITDKGTSADKTDEAITSKNSNLNDENGDLEGSLLDFFPDLTDESSNDSNPFGFLKDDSSTKTNRVESPDLYGDHSYCSPSSGKKINRRSKVLNLPNLNDDDSILDEIINSLSDSETNVVDDIASNVEIRNDDNGFVSKIYEYNVKVEVTKEKKLLISHFRTFNDGTIETNIVEETLDPSLVKVLKLSKPKKKKKDRKVYYRYIVKELDDGRRVSSIELKTTRFTDEIKIDEPPATPEASSSPKPNENAENDLYFDFDLADYLLKKGEEDLGLNELTPHSAIEDNLFSFL